MFKTWVVGVKDRLNNVKKTALLAGGEMGVPWSLYAAHTLSTWGDNMWWFAGSGDDVSEFFAHLKYF